MSHRVDGRDRTVGMMNGRWALLFKMSLVFIPIIMTVQIGWNAWQSLMIFDHASRLSRIETGLMPVSEREGYLQIIAKTAVIVEDIRALQGRGEQ